MNTANLSISSKPGKKQVVSVANGESPRSHAVFLVAVIVNELLTIIYSLDETSFVDL